MSIRSCRQLADRTLAGPGVIADLRVDIAFLSLPHGESAAVARALPEGVRVVDLGADHRLRDPADWRRAYGGTHAGSWPYGLPELPGARAEIARAARVAAPGCYPTAVILALHPLLDAGLVEPADLVVVAASGTSGAGRSAKLNLLGSEVMGDLSAYKVANHQHVPGDAAGLWGMGARCRSRRSSRRCPGESSRRPPRDSGQECLPRIFTVRCKRLMPTNRSSMCRRRDAGRTRRQ